MRTYFAYIRVSTVRQGERGSSLVEQQSAIERYGQKHGLVITEWFEERDTAAKRGRAVFRRMLTRLKNGNAHGMIMHKVDRGARNLADWAELASLMDLGIDIHFAHEAIDMSSRGGRLSADIQAVVASDYIRNLRQEVKKGMYGRLKQGILPYGAPPGYKNNGEGGQQKTIDPVQGPLVRETFERYATGNYSYETLIELMTARGLRNTAGKPFRISGICNLLRNSYYYGIIVTKGQTFSGAHEPLITKITFDACKAQREGRVAPRPEPSGQREYAFRRLIFCQTCSRSLIAERQKGHIYYRCHTRSCPTTCVRESSVIEQLRVKLAELPHFDQFETVLRRLFTVHMSDLEKRVETDQTSLALRLGQIKIRQNRLTELLIEDTINQHTYDAKKLEIQNQLIEIEEEKTRIGSKDTMIGARLEKMLELAKRLVLLPESENPRQLREMIKTATSNLSGYQKTIDIQWSNTFKVLFLLGSVPVCGGGGN